MSASIGPQTISGDHLAQGGRKDNNNSEMNSSTSLSSPDLDTYLAISYNDFKIGITYYRLSDVTIELLHEAYEYYDFSYTKSIIQKVHPTDIIISSKCDACLVKFLKSLVFNTTESHHNLEDENSLDHSDDSNVSVYFDYDPDDEPDGPIYTQFKLHFVSNGLFQYEQCKNRILSFNLPQMANMVDSKERFIYLTSNINFSEINTIKSLGVMLYFLEKNLSVNFGPPNAISNFAYFNYNHVTMDQTTFEALEIFQLEWHPSTSKKGFYKKEGLSVYGIFNICSSKLGSFQLKKMFQQPITNYKVLSERQETIEYFINTLNSSLKETLSEHLKNIKDIIPIFNRFKALNFQFADIETLFNIVSSVIFIRKTIMKIDKKLLLFSRIVSVSNNELEEINDLLHYTIDFQKSTANKCIEINKNVDEELDDLKMIFNKLPEILNRILQEGSEDDSFFSLNLRHVTNAYIPQLGFLFSIPLMQAQNINAIEQYDLELVFCANDKAYYKNKKMKEFDAHYGDIKSDINDQTQQVLMHLKDFILSRGKILKLSIALCAQLDALIAMAQVAINYHYVRPKLTCYGRIKIEGSRHPLYELMGNSFTANSFNSDENECKVSIIFGPNSCGKSVFLKQISLIVYLAHIGSFVPAHCAEITIVDQIFTRIRTPESVSTQLSSFKHDLNQIIMASKYASSRSLVVIDFFGKGTLSIDGYALLTACINHWIANYKRPHVIISSLFDLSACESNKVKFYTFESISGINSFKLIPFEPSHTEGENSQALLQMPKEIKLRTEKLISESFDGDLKDTFPELNEKYNEYIKLAECLVDQLNGEDFLNKVSHLLQPIINKYRI